MVPVAVHGTAAGSVGAVIDQQRGAVAELGRETLDEAERADRHDELAVDRPSAEHGADVARDRHPAFDEPVAVDVDADLALAANQPERQVVEQLVGEDEIRLQRSDVHDETEHVLEGPPGAGADLLGRVRARPADPRGEHLAREGAVAGPDLHDPHRFVAPWQAVGDPGEGACDEHPERGVHVRARDEVAAHADRRFLVEAAGAVQRDRHVRREVDRSVGGDPRSDRVEHLRDHGRSMAAPARMAPMQQPVEHAPPIRRAASLVCVRPGADGPEVLVVERSAGSRFLPGYVAFPGGALDADDEAIARRWFGTVEEGPPRGGAA